MDHMSHPDTVLITGSAGQLGRALRRQAPEAVDLVATDKTELDITNAEAAADTFDAVRPDWVMNAAAYTDVDQAEEERDKAFQVNAEGVAHLARAAEQVGSRMVHMSTDFVFDGNRSRPYHPDDDPSPVNVYGESKRAGERHVENILGDRAVILRTAWLYGVTHGDNFVRTMLRLMQERSDLQVVSDQVGTPTEVNGLARAIWNIVAGGLSGYHHWTPAGVASWYDVAIAIRKEAQDAGLLQEAADIQPVPTEAYPTPAARPSYSVLNKQPTWKALGQTPGHWREALRNTLHTEAQPAT